MTTQPKDTGGPAFPCDNILERNEKGQLIGVEKSSAGMTLRDYFAAKAMQGLLSSPGFLFSEMDLVPAAAFKMADAMLKAGDA